MKIEEEIKQSSFKSEHQKAHINLIYTSGWVQQAQASIFKPFGVTLPQYNVLRILRGQHPKPATISLLIERMLDKTSNASRIVDKLEAKELVTRKQCPADRRTVDVLITEKGLTLLKEMDALEGGQGTGISNLTVEEAKQLNTLLDKIRD
ncbi:MarR family transcriptional regulator [Pontibacter sp. E15-1]|uniref:MarR family winged helix-turn-helix transcriptional regulator n=1 Tax=Pontibacter sp. E15-1 TaxID=2919918 RepID=UPI001F4FD611|nr:MarR family transcriptional regulator [Pontibacter sp. E15-1]MCJ8165357.1 MarR family transcriptional regulator [Pontibacter sp. E15-1]